MLGMLRLTKDLMNTHEYFSGCKRLAHEETHQGQIHLLVFMHWWDRKNVVEHFFCSQSFFIQVINAD